MKLKIIYLIIILLSFFFIGCRSNKTCIIKIEAECTSGTIKQLTCIGQGRMSYLQEVLINEASPWSYEFDYPGDSVVTILAETETDTETVTINIYVNDNLIKTDSKTYIAASGVDAIAEITQVLM